MVSGVFLDGATVGDLHQKPGQRPSVTAYFNFDDDSDADGYAIDQKNVASPNEYSNCKESLEYEEFGAQTQGSWAQDRRELEASKLSFMRTQRQQQQVDENVRLLLQKLDELPGNSSPEKQLIRGERLTHRNLDRSHHAMNVDAVGLRKCVDHSDCDNYDIVDSSDDFYKVRSGKHTQRFAAVAQLLKAGVDITGTHIAWDDISTSEQEAKEMPRRERSPKQQQARRDKRGSYLAEKSPRRSARHLKRSQGALESRRERRDSQEVARPGDAQQMPEDCALDNGDAHLHHSDPPSTQSPKAHSLGTSTSAPLLQQLDAHVKHQAPLPRLEQQPANAANQWVPGSNWTPLVPASYDSIDHKAHSASPVRSADVTPERPAIPQFKLVQDPFAIARQARQGSHIEDELFPTHAARTPEPVQPMNTNPYAMDESIQWSPPFADKTVSPALAVRCGRRRSSVDYTAGLDPFARWPSDSSNSAEPTMEPTFDQGCASHGAPGHVVVDAEWRGWAMKTTADGELFYFHEDTGTSQWRTPRELLCVLGEWTEVADDRGNAYWANEVLGMSCWTDPRCTANIFQAAYDGDLFFAQLYVVGSGNLNVVDSAGCTALHYACASSSEDMAAYLLQNGARPDVQDLSRGRPLHWACNYSHSGAVKALLSAGADPDHPDANGDTPLHLAASANCIAAVQFLMEARANPTRRNKQGMLRPSQVAVSQEIAAMLQEYERQNSWSSQPKLEAARGEIVSGDLESTTAMIRRSDSNVVKHPGRDFAYHDEDEEPTTPGMVVARLARKAVRPVVQGVQWVANRVLPVDDKRTKCWELGHGAPILESNRIDKLIASIPRSSLEGVLSRDQSCFDDPPGFERDDSRQNYGDYGSA